MRIIVALLLLPAVLAGAVPGPGSSIELVVTGAEPGEGRILASLYGSSDSYMREPLMNADVQVDADGLGVIDFGEHEPGEYAIAVIYDRNENGKLDSNLLRIPKEKIGFSNNARGRFGPAKWDDARFVLGDGDVRVEIELKKAIGD